MNWTRKHSDDIDPAHFKEWRGGRGKYRITWRDQVGGANVPPGFHACVFEAPLGWEGEVWTFVKPSGPGGRLLRTLQAAKHACERDADPSYRPPRKKRRKK